MRRALWSWIGIGATALLLLAAPDAEAAGCGECRAEKWACKLEGALAYKDCRLSCDGDATCRDACRATRQSALGACRSDQSGCEAACDGHFRSCAEGCAAQVRACLGASSSGARGCTRECRDGFRAAVRACRGAEDRDARRACIEEARQALVACARGCHGDGSTDAGLCRAELVQCVQGCRPLPGAVGSSASFEGFDETCFEQCVPEGRTCAENARGALETCATGCIGTAADARGSCASDDFRSELGCLLDIGHDALVCLGGCRESAGEAFALCRDATLACTAPCRPDEPPPVDPPPVDPGCALACKTEAMMCLPVLDEGGRACLAECGASLEPCFASGSPAAIFECLAQVDFGSMLVCAKACFEAGAGGSGSCLESVGMCFEGCLGD